MFSYTHMLYNVHAMFYKEFNIIFYGECYVKQSTPEEYGGKACTIKIYWKTQKKTYFLSLLSALGSGISIFGPFGSSIQSRQSLSPSQKICCN